MIGTHTKATSRERGNIYLRFHLSIEVVETVRLAKKSIMEDTVPVARCC